MKYVIVCWPDSQILMQKSGFFDHCSLINSERGIDEYGSSAYLVDKEWYQDLIEDKLEDMTQKEIDEHQDDELDCIYDDSIIFNEN